MNEGWDGILLGSRGMIVLCIEIVWPYSGYDLRIPLLECDTWSSSSVKLASQQTAK